MKDMPELGDANEDPKTAASAVKGYTMLPALNAVFQPTAELLGARLRERVERIFEDADEARQSNLFDHLSTVTENDETKNIQPTSAQSGRQLQQWMDSVSYVSCDDSELCAAWHALYGRIVSGQPYADLLLDQLKNLSTTEFTILSYFRRYELKFMFFRKVRLSRQIVKEIKLPLDSYYFLLSSLELKGLLKEKNEESGNMQAIFGWYIILSLIFIGVFYDKSTEIKEYFNNETVGNVLNLELYSIISVINTMLIAGLVILSVLVVGQMFSAISNHLKKRYALFTKHKLTSLGNLLMDTAPVQKPLNGSD